MSAAADVHAVPEVVVDSTRRTRAWWLAFRTPAGLIGLFLMALVTVAALAASSDCFRLTPQRRTSPRH